MRPRHKLGPKKKTGVPRVRAGRPSVLERYE